MLKSLNVDVAKARKSVKARQIGEKCANCDNTSACREWLSGDVIGPPLYRKFCANAEWLDTLQRLGPPQNVALDDPQIEPQLFANHAETGLSPLQQQFLEQLKMSGDIAITTNDKTSIFLRTVAECHEMGLVRVKEVSPEVSVLSLNEAA